MRVTSRMVVLFLTICFFQCQAESVKQWERWEKTFTAPAREEIVFDIHYHAPSGKIVVGRGFWDGGKSWKARFMPDETGTWKYEIISKFLKSVKDAKGQIKCVANPGKTVFEQHGAIQVSKNGRHFEHADGTPFFWMADTVWSGALSSKKDHWEKFLKNRVENKFTGIQYNAAHWKTATHSLEGLRAFSGYEKIKINPKFFKRIDERTDMVNEHGLLAVPVVMWNRGTKEHDPGFLPESEAIKLGQYIVARYSANHVAWFLAGDGDYLGEDGQRWIRIGRGIFDGLDHGPVFMHPGGRRWPYNEFLTESWMSAVGYQTGHSPRSKTVGWLLYGQPAKDWVKKPNKPYVNLEPIYEGIFGHSYNKVRPAMYWSCLVHPTAGVSFGVHGVWSWEVKKAVPKAHQSTGKAEPWHIAMKKPGSTMVKHLSTFFQSCNWWELVPDPKQNKFFKLGVTQKNPEAKGGKFNKHKHYVAISTSRKGNLLVAYLPMGGSLQLSGGGLKSGLKAKWFDPREGVFTPAKKSGPNTYITPDHQDWLLLIQ